MGQRKGGDFQDGPKNALIHISSARRKSVKWFHIRSGDVLEKGERGRHQREPVFRITGQTD